MGDVEIPKWLEGLPLAPVFRPTDTEFADPIAYISKIEKEASSFGICKIIPPLPKPSKKYVLSNLNRSLSKCPDLDDQVSLQNVDLVSKSGCGEKGSVSEARAVFTTRQQELGQNVKKTKGGINNPPLGAHKQVWQSGEVYTLEQFEAKSKAFARTLLGAMKEVNPIDIEALFWQAASEKPIYVEYANDVPGSGFGEPEGQFHYLHRRRRRTRTYYQRSRESSCGKKNVEHKNEFFGSEVKDSSSRDSLALSEVISTPSSALSSISPLETCQAHGKTSSSIGSEMEGTAGWKLSNSPWNLQMIARSPGSLTRFMPDDIPGVTSPMVYIGMLFSWFAWHVEDHELHSMNFLHMGSPKTWYSVPGDHAFAFEEVIRSEAYGGNNDRLAALTLLGEKTTLLSPEVIVASDIPCCRLVQHPGEFVVTFPRAYHVGFSHGFNCGEAANFATSQWLRFAKEAAIRRAAMSYLPMLSHQQLLYLLTMSFVARLPRSLLSGARSSRLRDRQREEREHLVKKAFVQDILKENNLLSSLLDGESGSHAVVWNPDLLPSISRESQLVDRTASVAITSEEDMPSTPQSNSNPMNLFKEMSLYMEGLNDLYVDKDDLLFDFQVDSGALACAACGILGFPFMSVMQPAEIAVAELLPADYASLQLHDNPVSAASCEHGEEATKESSANGWNTSSKFLKPRVFCLEHAIQIKKLLQSKGGINMLVLCHSDYQKIKAYAAAIAEETSVPFNYKEISLLRASEQELNLIDLAIEDDENGCCTEDWTSKLGVNLRYCVKVRKICPSKQVEHALSLGGLFTDENSGLTVLNVKWQSRKSRSKIRSENPQNRKSSKSCENEKVSEDNFDVKVVKKEEKLLHYSRRNRLKSNVPAGTSSCEHPQKQLTEEVPLAICGDGDHILRVLAKPSPSCTTNKFAAAAISAVTDLEHEVQVVEATGNARYDFVPDKVSKSLPSSTLSTGNIEVEVINQIPDKVDIVQESSELAKEDCHDEMPEEVEFSKRENVNASSVRSSVSLATDYIGNVHKDHGEIMEIGMDNSCDLPSDDQCIGSAIVQKAEGALKVSCAYANVCLESTEVFKEDRTTMELCKEVASVGEVHVKEPCVTENSSSQFLPEHTENCTASVEDAPNVVRVPNSLHGEHDFSNGFSFHSHATEEIECVEGSRDGDATSCLRTATANHGPAAIYEHSHIPYSAEESIEVTRRTSSEEQTLHKLALNDECQHADNPEDVCQIASDRTTKESLDADGSLDDGLKSVLGSSSLRENLTPTDEKHDGSCGESFKMVHSRYDSDVSSSHDGIKQGKRESATDLQLGASGKKRKRKHEIELISELPTNGFIRSPCEGLRSRSRKDGVKKSSRSISMVEEEKPAKRTRQPSKDGTNKSSSSVSLVEEEKSAERTGQPSKTKAAVKGRKEKTSGAHKCTLEGCRMSFNTKEELVMHKRNRCPHEGCGKKFSSHKYLVNHQRVHEDDRPLKCPWKGCSMTFKWAWARTEHIRVHTGERPYKCKVCGLDFRFVSDYSRHRRKTGHYVKS